MFFLRFARADVADGDDLAPPVDGCRFVFRPDLDVILVPEAFRIHEDEVGALRDQPVQVVGDAAVGKGDERTLFQQDNLCVFVKTAQAGGRGSAAGHTADDDILMGQNCLLPPGGTG